MDKTARNNGRSDRRERRKEETRRLILETAMKLFEKKGVFATTVEEITETADIGKGTFFNYFYQYQCDPGCRSKGCECIGA